MIVTRLMYQTNQKVAQSTSVLPSAESKEQDDDASPVRKPSALSAAVSSVRLAVLTAALTLEAVNHPGITTGTPRAADKWKEPGNILFACKDATPPWTNSG